MTSLTSDRGVAWRAGWVELSVVEATWYGQRGSVGSSHVWGSQRRVPSLGHMLGQNGAAGAQHSSGNLWKHLVPFLRTAVRIAQEGTYLGAPTCAPHMLREVGMLSPGPCEQELASDSSGTTWQ